MTFKWINWKAFLALIAGVSLFSAGALIGANTFGKPDTVIHVVTVKWKDGTTQQQIDAALKGVEKMAAEIPGMKNVWLKATKTQGPVDTAFVMEFESAAAQEAYAKHPAHAAWYKIYIPIRERSLTHDITN
jgi:multidrug efflux pump subunit AcrB